MLKSIFTLDYEIHGNGDGCPYALMVEPTERMLRQFDEHTTHVLDRRAAEAEPISQADGAAGPT